MAFEPSLWEARSERARQIAHLYASAAEALVFYADLAEFQEELLRSLSARRDSDVAPGSAARGSLIETLDQARYRALVPKLLSWLQRAAPPPLASSAQRLLDDDPLDRQRMFDAYWAWAVGDKPMGDETRAFVVEAVLQPFAEVMARTTAPESETAGSDAAEPPSEIVRSRCPVCGGRPVVGLLREAGHGARRSLVCGLCCTEWRVPRLTCPACGEARSALLSTIRADQFPNAQVDVCGACSTYVKTLDLTRNNTMIASVDDLATLPLDLWAREQGLTRVRPHLLRL